MKSLWTAYLSNGECINEQDLFVHGDLLPFRKLVKYAVKNNLTINSVTLNINGVRYNSPSIGSNGYFPSAIKPEKFWVLFRTKYLMMQQKEYSFIGLSWIVGEIRTTLWVSLSNNQNNISWIETAGLDTPLEKLVNETYETV